MTGSDRRIVCAVVERGGRVLLQERDRRGGRVLEFPSGAVEPGEDFTAAAIRELREETGLTASPVVAGEVTMRSDDGAHLGFVRLVIADDAAPRQTDPRRRQVFSWQTWSEVPAARLPRADQRFVTLMRERAARPPIAAILATHPPADDRPPPEPAMAPLPASRDRDGPDERCQGSRAVPGPAGLGAVGSAEAMPGASWPEKLPRSVLVVVRSRDGQVLLLERADGRGLWQSVTGSIASSDEPLAIAARRELHEETGLTPEAGELIDRETSVQFEIVALWRPRYAPGVRHNTEHWFEFVVPAPRPIRCAPAEHRAAIWLPAEAAADRCFSWTNAAAIRDHPAR